ncbi:MAG: M1 family aminopeptidase [Candidatus Kapaibacteriales bacterium]
MNISLLIIFFSIVFALIQPLVSQISKPTEYIPQAFDIIHYDIELDLTKGMNKFIAGKSKMNFIWKDKPESSCFYFHLRDLSVDSVFFDDSLFVSFEPESLESIDYSYYKVCNLIGSIGDTHSITVYYSGIATTESGDRPFGGVFLMDSILFSIGVGFRNDYVSTTQHWLACYDHPSDKATYRIRFIVPKGFTVATNGITKYIGQTVDENDIWESASRFPIATYLLTFAMGKFIKLSPGKEYLPWNLEYSIYCLPKDSIAVDWAFRNFFHSFFALQNRWGRYPFEKIGFVVVPFSAGAMEHQTMITFPSSVVNDLYAKNDTLNVMGCHELAHQWFGNSVSPLDFRDAWFNEAFATFSESIFYEMLLGKEEYLRKLLADKDLYVKYVVPYEGALPLYNYSRKFPSSNYPATIYLKGAVVLGMLRYHLGDDLFFDLVRRYLDLNAYSSKSTADFVSFCEDYAETPLQWFFNQWIYSKGYPNFEIRVRRTPTSAGFAKVNFHFRQIQPKSYGSYLNVPVEINFLLHDSSQFDTVVVVPSVDCEIELDSIPDFLSISFNGGRRVVGLYSFATYLTSGEWKFKDDVQVDWSNLNRALIISGLKEGEYRFTIYDVFGRVYDNHKFIVSGSDNFMFDLNAIPTGVYLVQLCGEGKSVIRKILCY